MIGPKPSFHSEALQQVIDNALSSVCVDCMEDDWRYSDKLFLSMFSVHISALRYQYGNLIPISEKIATICLKSGLYKENLVSKNLDGEYKNCVKITQNNEESLFLKFV